MGCPSRSPFQNEFMLGSLRGTNEQVLNVPPQLALVVEPAVWQLLSTSQYPIGGEPQLTPAEGLQLFLYVTPLQEEFVPPHL
jgi:hypothetical protein